SVNTVPSVRLSISASLDREKAGDLRVSQQTQDPENPEFGPNQWLVDALHEQWQKDPSSVDPSWAEYFASSSSTPTPDSTADEPSGPPEAASEPEPAPAPDRDPGQAESSAAPASQSPSTADSTASTQPAKVPTTTAPIPAVELQEPEVGKLRGPANAVVRNMDESLTVPTATSVRDVPVKLLFDNRIVINNHLKRNRAGKVSFTHLIGWA